MAKDNTSPQKLPAPTKQQNETEQSASTKPGKRGSSMRSNKPQIGGTAVPGARSTQPREIPATSNPQQQQAESYNRVMRRRMDNMGMGASAESDRMQTLQQQRQKRIERKKKRLEERRQELRKSLPPSKIKLGRRVLYPLIGVAVLVVLLIVLFIVFGHPIR